MRRKIHLLLLMLLCAMSAGAQKYDVKCLHGDSAKVYEVVEKWYDSSITGKREKSLGAGDNVVFYLKNGEQIDATERFRVSEALSDSHTDYAVFRKNGKQYCVNIENIVFSKSNPSGVEDKLLSRKNHIDHSWQGRLFNSITPYIIIALLFFGVMVLNVLATKNAALKRTARIAIPACILLGTLLEVWAYRVLGTGCFWWCDKARYGFFGSLLRIIPFAIIVFYQIMSIRFYEPVLFGDDFNSDVHDGISVKPALISILIAFPVLIVAAIIEQKAGLNGSFLGELLLAVAFLGSLLLGLAISAKRNIERIGDRKLGLLVTFFTVAYIIGCIVAVWGLVVVVFRLIIQLLVCAAVLVYFLRFMPADMLKSSAPQRTWVDKAGGHHTNEVDRNAANRRIDERRAESGL